MAEKKALSEALEELTLLLLYLGSWEERPCPQIPASRRAWKGFLFEALDALEAKGYLAQTRRAKSVALTDTGVVAAEALKRRYGIGEEAPD